MKFVVCSILLLLAACGSTDGKKSYKRYQLISVQAETPEHVQALVDLEGDEFLSLDFWSGPSRAIRTDILVAPQVLGETKRRLRAVGLTPEIKQKDIQDLMDAEEASREEAKARARSSTLPNYLINYLTYEEILNHLYNLQAAYQDIVSVEEGPDVTYEGRSLVKVKVSKNDGIQRKAIWIEAATHAREWITIPSALYLMEKVANNDEGLLDKFDWYFAPVHNPDGYEHTFNDRMWRKNREVFSTGWFGCTGVDLNRNWDINWSGPGASSNCRDYTYYGPGPASTSEVKWLKQAVESTPDVIAFFSLHCYSQLILVPYGYKYEKPARYDDLYGLAKGAADAIFQYSGRNFTVGTPPDLLYVASGGAFDYFHANGVKYSYTYELRPATNSQGGFVLSAAEIIPAAEETFASMKYFANEIYKMENVY